MTRDQDPDRPAPSPGHDDPIGKPRFRDIAAEAGVGTATVERVLNARGNVAPDTVRRVLIAAKKLGSNRILPPARHAIARVEVILVRRETSFFERLNAAFQAIAPGVGSSLKLYRTFVAENVPDEIARRIEAVAGQREAFIVVVQDHPRIVAALAELDRRGKPVILLVSNVEYGGRAIYVGIDNESAGRTAGYLMRSVLADRAGVVLALCHSGAYAVHRERIIGFSQYFGDVDDRLAFVECLVTQDTDERAYQAVSAALGSRPDVVGIYHAGGGNEGVMRAIGEHRRLGDVVYVGHELSAVNRSSLARGIMLAALDQQPELQVKRAVDTVELAIGLRRGLIDRSPIPFRIVTPENI